MPAKRSSKKIASDEIINGIVSYLSAASEDGIRFKEVLDLTMKQQSAATMIEVAFRYTGFPKQRSKIAAKRILIENYNKNAMKRIIASRRG